MVLRVIIKMRVRDEKLLEDIILYVCQSAGVELYDWQIRGKPGSQTLAVYIYTREGVTIDDCARVSEALGDELDMEDIFRSSYILEVSSPGLERELRQSRHFLTAVGERVEIEYQDKENQIRKLVGELISSAEDFIEVQIAQENEPEKIFYKQIKKARTRFVWHKANQSHTKRKGN
jgi:ribosome maturation factor RimP